MRWLSIGHGCQLIFGAHYHTKGILLPNRCEKCQVTVTFIWYFKMPVGNPGIRSSLRVSRPSNIILLLIFISLFKHTLFQAYLSAPCAYVYLKDILTISPVNFKAQMVA